MNHIIELYSLKWQKVQRMVPVEISRYLVTLNLKLDSRNFPQRLHIKVIASTASGS